MSKIPKNIRFRPDQIEGLTKLEDSETDFSALVRKAVDDLLAKRRTQRAKEEAPAPSYGTKRKPPSRKATASQGRRQRGR